MTKRYCHILDNNVSFMRFVSSILRDYNEVACRDGKDTKIYLLLKFILSNIFLYDLKTVAIRIPAKKKSIVV